MNVATIGTGFIVDWFLTAVQESANISCVAMFSRKESSARMLADKYEIDKIYTNLDDMLKDEEINFVYVASPNSLHFEHALKALQAGKNVICEKPFTSTVEEFDRLVKEAQDREFRKAAGDDIGIHELLICFLIHNIADKSALVFFTAMQANLFIFTCEFNMKIRKCPVHLRDIRFNGGIADI